MHETAGQGREDKVQITITAELDYIKNGVRARSQVPVLAAHGTDEETAVQALRTAATAWVEGMRRTGLLEDRLRAIGQVADEDDQGVIDVDIVASWSKVAV
jgi:hypothetical protein